MNAIPLIVGAVVCFYAGYIIKDHTLTPVVVPAVTVVEYFTPRKTASCDGGWCVTEGVESEYRMELGQ